MTPLEHGLMTGEDEGLLRQLIGQMASLKVRVDSIATSLEEKVIERREHANGLEGRVVALDNRVRAIELLGARGENIPGSVHDHEARIRVLERMKWQVLATAFVGSGLGWIATTFIIR